MCILCVDIRCLKRIDKDEDCKKQDKRWNIDIETYFRLLRN